MNKLRIAILGTRGIPNHYGGFEQLAEYLSTGLANKGHDLTVYNSHLHPFKKDNWKNVKIIHRRDPENFVGTFGQFIYDLGCIRHAARQSFDVILFMGYTSNSVWGRLYPKKTVIISHMDGLEWKREKYSAPVKSFLKHAESLAVRYSHFYIADSRIIQSYLHNKYNIHAVYLSYGAEVPDNQNSDFLSEYGISPYSYCMIMARMEPENNIATIVEAFHGSSSAMKLLVLGNTENQFGRKIRRKYSADKRILFAGACYDKEKVHALRSFSTFYFHGHSAGGTNPSLLEAMASRAVIVAHDNPFNREVLGENGLFFTTVSDIGRIISSTLESTTRKAMIENNFQKIKSQHNWEQIIEQYEKFIINCCEKIRT